MKHTIFFIRAISSYAGGVLYLNLIGMVLISLAEGIGILLLIPLLNVIGVLDISSDSYLLSKISQYTQSFSEILSVPLILGLYILLMIGQSYLQRNQTLLQVKIQQGFAYYLRLKTYSGLMKSDYSLFLKKRKSDLSNFLTSEIARVNAGVGLLLQFLASFIFTVIQIGFAFWLSFELTLLVLISGLALIFIARNFMKRAKTIGNQAIDLSESYLAAITDDFNGIKDIKSNTLEETHLNWFDSLCSRMEQNQIEFFKMKTASQTLFKSSSAILIAFFIYTSVELFDTSSGELILVIIIFSRLWPRFMSFQSNLEQLYSFSPSFKRLMDLQQESEMAKEIKEDTTLNNKVLSIQQGLECRNIYFRYRSQELNYALKDVSISIPNNQMTAIVGRSGAGKSTLIDVLMGLISPERGMVCIDGVPLTSNNIISLRRSVSYVSQDPFLFNASIRENLLLIKPNARESELWEALEFSSAAEFVRKLSQGLDTVIGDRGIRLSGGERQRLVLARAILKKPSILILDEATSSLDTENERRIQEALERIKGKMTIIVIAHRLSTIQNADQVIVLDRGKVVQQGEFHSLAKEKRGVFSQLLGSQTRVSL